METTLAAIEVRQSVEALYRAEGDRLWHAVYAFAGDAEIASDAVAEAYAQVLARGDVVRDPAAWTWRTAFRISAGALKARRSEDAARAPLGDHVDRHADADLHAARAELPRSQRAAVVLFYYADLPVRAIADRLATNQLAVRANLSRGRRRLRELLGDRDA